MTPILYEKDEIDFTSQGLGSLVEIYDVDVEEQRNGLLQLTASYPVSGVRYADISVGRIILAKPNQRDDVHAFRIVSTELDISGYAVKIEADSITYDLTHNVVKHLVASGIGQAFMIALKNAIVNPSIFAFYSDIATSSTTSLNYVNPMEAIMGTTGSFLQIWGGELKRENRRVAMFNRRGRDNVATFRLGKNISGLKYSVDISSLVTRIIPTKSVQNDNQTTTILEGAPVDSQYINNYEQIYTLPLEFTDDTIKTVADLNAAAKGWFTKSANTGRDKPTVTIDIDVLSLQDSADYQYKFKNLESVSLTDTVTVYVPEYGVNVTAIVNELHYDPILDRVTKMTVGTAKQSFADSSRTQLSDLQDKIISVQNQADAVAVSANGKSTNYYGSVEPSHPQKGDTWFWVNGDKSGIKVFVNGDWVEPVDSDTQEKIEASVTKAVSQAKAHTDEVKQGLSSDIATAKSQAASLASTAEANAKSEATSLFSTAQNALSDAKKDLTESIASEASQAVAAANSQAQNYVNQAKSDITDTINALSVGGRNLYQNSMKLTEGYGVNGNVTVTVEPFDSTTNMWHMVAPQRPGTGIGIYIWDYGSGKIPDNSDWSYSADIKGTGKVVRFGIEDSNRNPIKGTIGSEWSRISQTGHVGEPQAKTLNMYFETTNSPLDVYIKLPKLETGNIATDYTPAPEDVVIDYTTKDNKIKETISQYQENINGHVGRLQTDVTTALGQITTKISQTDYDKKTGDLSTKINDVKDTADESLQTIGDYKTSNDKRVHEAESKIKRTAEAITETVSKTDYDKKTGELNHDLSELKHTAEGFEATVTKVDNLSVGGRNLLLGTATPWTVKANDNNWNFNPIYDHLKGGTTYTFSAEISVSNGQDSVSVAVLDYQSGSTWAFSPDFSKGVKRGSFTFTTPDHVDNDGHFLVYAGTKEHTAGLSATYTHMKLEEGNVPTAWTPAPEDVDSTISKVKQTADEASTAVSKLTSADGIITKVQADIKVNADAITKKVSKEVYDQKTGELSEKINKAKDTADESLRTIGDYKTSNDKRVHDAESSIERTANAITAKVSQTDYDKKTGDLTEAVSKVKVTADGINNFVRDSSGNISSDFQTALSKMSIITGSTLATSIQTQTSSQISSAITDNNGKIISLINQDSSGVQIAGKNLAITADTTVDGNFWAKQVNAVRVNATNITAGTLNASNVNIINLDVNSLTGNVSNFIQSNWNGEFGSVSIDPFGMRVSTVGVTTEFSNSGMSLTRANELTGGIGVQGWENMPYNYQGLHISLNGIGDFMSFGARDNGVQSGLYTSKLAWMRGDGYARPIGMSSGWTFMDDVKFDDFILPSGSSNQKMVLGTSSFNGNDYPYFGDSRNNAGLAYGSSQIYLVSDDKYYNLVSVIRGLSGLGSIQIPKEIRSDGTVARWSNVSI